MICKRSEQKIFLYPTFCPVAPGTLLGVKADPQTSSSGEVVLMQWVCSGGLSSPTPNLLPGKSNTGYFPVLSRRDWLDYLYNAATVRVLVTVIEDWRQTDRLGEPVHYDSL